MDEHQTPPPQRLVEIIFGVVLVLAVVIAFRVAFHRSFQVDEVEHVHAAYSMKSGALVYRDFWEPHNPLIWLLIYPVIDTTDPVTSHLSARMVTFLLLLLGVGLSAALATRIAGRSAGWLTAGMLLVHTTFVERGMEIRPDLGLAMATVGALWSVTSSRPTQNAHMGSAAWLGIAYLFTPKCLFMCAAFGLIWLVRAIRERRFSFVALPCLVFAAFPLTFLATLAGLGNLEGYLAANIYDLAKAATTEGVGFKADDFLIHESSRNLLFILLVVLGASYVASQAWVGWFQKSRLVGAVAALIACAVPLVTGRPVFLMLPAIVGSAFLWARVATTRTNALEISFFVAAVSALGLWLNPFPFPYLHVSALPVLAVASSSALVIGAGHLLRPRWLTPMALAFVAGNASIAAPRLLNKGKPTTQDQFAHLEAINQVTRPDQTVFDMTGLYFRPDAYPHVPFTSVGAQRYRSGRYPRMIPYWRERKMAAFIVSYRTAWLPPEEQQFLQQNYVGYAGAILLQGQDLSGMKPGQRKAFEVLEARVFRVDGEANLLVNGEPFQKGTLPEGTHELTVSSTVTRARIIVDVPPPSRELLRSSRSLYVNFD